MKVKIISGIVLMTLSSFSMAVGHASAGSSVNDLSRSPFQADRDRARKQAGNMTPMVSATQQKRSVAATLSPAGQPAAMPPEKQTVAGAYNPWLTLNLQESHLLSLDIDAWAKSQGMRLLWNSNRDYLIYSAIHLTGTNRDDVLNQLGELFRSENYGLVIKLYEKNNVLVIDGQ